MQPRHAILAALVALAPVAAFAYSGTYRPVAATIRDLGKDDASFQAFRQRVVALARAKDRSGILALAAPNFRYVKDLGGNFQARKTPAVNLARALLFEDKGQAAGFAETIRVFQSSFGSSSLVKREICAPAEPRYDDKALQALLTATKTDVLGDWDVVKPGTIVREKPDAAASAIATLGAIFLHIQESNKPTGWSRVLTPDGRVGYVGTAEFSSIFDARLCVAKDAKGMWRITTWIGGGD